MRCLAPKKCSIYEWLNKWKRQLCPSASSPKGPRLLTSSSRIPFQVIQLNFLLGFFQLFIHVSQFFLDLFMLALEEMAQGPNWSWTKDLGWSSYPWCFQGSDWPPSAQSPEPCRIQDHELATFGTFLTKSPPRPKTVHLLHNPLLFGSPVRDYLPITLPRPSLRRPKCPPGPWAQQSICASCLSILIPNERVGGQTQPFLATVFSHPWPPLTTHLELLDLPEGL